MLRPLGDRLVVKPLPAPEKSIGGIILPEDARDDETRGTILAIGSKVEIDVKAGDTVLYGKWGGTTTKDDQGEELVIVRESDVIAVIEA